VPVRDQLLRALIHRFRSGPSTSRTAAATDGSCRAAAQADGAILAGPSTPLSSSTAAASAG
jgi:hypothetical protein